MILNYFEQVLTTIIVRMFKWQPVQGEPVLLPRVGAWPHNPELYNGWMDVFSIGWLLLNWSNITLWSLTGDVNNTNYFFTCYKVGYIREQMNILTSKLMC